MLNALPVADKNMDVTLPNLACLQTPRGGLKLFTLDLPCRPLQEVRACYVNLSGATVIHTI